MPSTADTSNTCRRHPVGLLLLLCLLLPAFSYADTLFQRSGALLEEKARQASADDYCFVVMGDSRSNDAIFAKALRTAAGFKPLFILHGGDYSTEGGEEETGNFLSLVEKNAPCIPVFVVLGNHENPRVFEREIGPPRFALSVPRLGLKVVALDNSREALHPLELDYLKKELASAPGATFVAMHVPPETGRWRGHTFVKGAAELERMVAAAPAVQGLFFAHSHLYDASVFGGVPAFISGGAGAPLVWISRYGERVNHIIVVRVKNGRASYQMVQLK
ncbi:metallophosphoesterase [Geomonas nitrogeniifigens]|uniref:Metallophosphoesterase n=1 Tax=Geomonas diazotrophica TaxID=2843197 RepID=A0ABX8JP56_9BACT|nr:metallophosphoesterase [Geomonas nitrogeniifigens]QWV99187.1 metallophosphoesterase [Geomonas nitrogeniifigens]QXE88356.1 metallophosphoesterase [Geomonas nitrogeniifigens]